MRIILLSYKTEIHIEYSGQGYEVLPISPFLALIPVPKLSRFKIGICCLTTEDILTEHIVTEQTPGPWTDPYKDQQTPGLLQPTLEQLHSTLEQLKPTH